MHEPDNAAAREQAIGAFEDLLGSWRVMLRTLLDVQLALPPGQLPHELPVGIARARAEIGQIKARLRAWGHPADDQPGEQEQAGPQQIEHQLRLLAIYRRNAEQLHTQRSQFAARDLPLHIASGLAEARENIARIEAQLRLWGVPAGEPSGEA